jgi:hypothetical protein
LRQLVLTPDLRADSVDWHSMAGWKRFVLMGLMVALPVPMFAASGLAVPLPSIVYRAAVGMAERTQAVAVAVPGFEAVVAETTEIARRGTIRLSPEELATRLVESSALATPKEARPNRTVSPKPPASPAARREAAQKTSAARPRPGRPVGAANTEAGRRVTKVTRPDSHAQPPQPHVPARPEPASEKKEPPAAEARDERSHPSPVHPQEPKSPAPKEEPKSGPTPSPPPALPPPPASLPPLPVTTPIDPLPDPVPLTPKAQLEEIAADLKEIADTRTVDRVAQALEKVQSAVERLEKKPPDNQGAVGDIKNAVQKLDDALAEGEISLAERTLFVSRLKAVSKLLAASP